MSMLVVTAKAMLLLVLLVAFGCQSESQDPAPRQSKGESPPPQANPVVLMSTSMGPITIELLSDKAPLTVQNFLQYADAGFYDGTIFHRVISDFMIQGGGFGPDMQQKPTRDPIRNEARSDLKNTRGTIAMARTGEVHSATAQFFINVKDNPFLDHVDQTARGFGYCVFGKVTDGLDVVDRIKMVSTGRFGPHGDVPTEPVIIESVRRR